MPEYKKKHCLPSGFHLSFYKKATFMILSSSGLHSLPSLDFAPFRLKVERQIRNRSLPDYWEAEEDTKSPNISFVCHIFTVPSLWPLWRMGLSRPTWKSWHSTPCQLRRNSTVSEPTCLRDCQGMWLDTDTGKHFQSVWRRKIFFFPNMPLPWLILLLHIYILFILAPSPQCFCLEQE